MLVEMFAMKAEYLWLHYYTVHLNMCLALSQNSTIINHK